MPDSIPRSGAFAAWLVAMVLAVAAHAASPEQISRGEYLTRAGDCAACHTAPGGANFAGGLAINSPFGTMYASNITPDRATGIGDWTDDEFYAALHDGMGRGGLHLYPSMPYQWYTKVTRDDVTAIRAYLATVPPVNAPVRRNTMMFPFSVRAGIAAWNAAYFKPGDFKPDPARSDELNRGAYLVEGLGHCGDCHTPKAISAAPIERRAYSGGMIDNWYAPNITSDPQRGIGGWPDDRLVQYLKTGLVPGKAAVVGPMAQVVQESLSHLTDADLRAIVAYLKAIPPITDYTPARLASLSGPNPAGAEGYLTNCASCHQQNGQGQGSAIPPLDGNSTVQAKGPQNVIRVILGGHLASGTYAIMPAVGADMTNAEIADVTNYIRQTWSNAAPATAEPGMVGDIRQVTTSFLSAPGSDRCDDLEARTIPRLDDPSRSIDALLGQITAANMPDHVDQLVTQARKIAGTATQADIVNGLAVQYCRMAARTTDAGDPSTGRPAPTPQEREAAARRLLTRFTQLVYTRLASNQPVGQAAPPGTLTWWHPRSDDRQQEGPGATAHRDSTHLDETERDQAAQHAAPGALVIHEVVRQEGEAELVRGAGATIWSGLAAGLSMGFSFLAMALVQAGLPDNPSRHLIDSAAYSVGFIIAVLGRQELFTESTLTAVLPLLVRRNLATLAALLRFWALVLSANVAGTLIFAALISRDGIFADPVREALQGIAHEAVSGEFWPTLTKAVFAGWLIALMVWLLPSARSARILVVLVLTYVVAVGRFSHIIAGSVEAGFAVFTGAASIREYATGFFLPTIIGNTIGGVALVALLNHAPLASELSAKRTDA